MLRYTFFVFIIACGGSQGCGSRSASAPTPEEPAATTATAVVDSPVQAVHEWGLVSVRPGGVELAAGPGQQQLSRLEMLTIDKPVLYVHASTPTSLHVEVAPGEGMSVAEHYPPAQAPLTWDVAVASGECTTPRDYTGACNSTDGYCETHELALYETNDASCLTQGELSLPLLFYRLRADTPPALPLIVERSVDNGAVLRNAGLEAGASVWRVSWDGESTHATRMTVPAAGEEFTILRAVEGGVADVRAAMRADLALLGLTRQEGEAFMRAWDSALFGPPGSVDEDGAVDGPRPVDGIPADIPPADGPVDIDSLTTDETVLDDRVSNNAPRVTDALLYWLPASNIESMAALTFRPVPQKISRAILVRVDLN